MDVINNVIKEQAVAAQFLARLEEKAPMPTLEIKVQGAEEGLELSVEEVTLLLEILSSLAKGKVLAVLPSEKKLNVQEAANLLDIYPAHVNQLVEDEKLPYEKVENDYYFVLEDVVAYQQNMREEREQHLQFLADQAQELNLGY